jgi:hypothetical protein
MRARSLGSRKEAVENLHPSNWTMGLSASDLARSDLARPELICLRTRRSVQPTPWPFSSLMISKNSVQSKVLSGRLYWKDEDLAGVDTIWIADEFSVRPVNDRIARPIAIGDTADAPEAITMVYDRSRILGRPHSQR